MDDSFPTAQFLSYKTNYDIETLIVEINLKKREWFLNGSYNPNKSQISHHLECLNRILGEYNSEYDKFFFPRRLERKCECEFHERVL